jgi:hypothetical protein
MVQRLKRQFDHTDEVPNEDPSAADEAKADVPTSEPLEGKIWATPQIGRSLPLPSNRACLITGVAAGVLDGALLLNDGRPFGRSIIAALFLGVFVYGGMRLTTAARRKIRPDHTSATVRPADEPTGQSQTASPSQTLPGAPKGGWANPTPTQKFTARLTRILSNYGKRR